MHKNNCVLDILYEDNYIAVVNKSAGLLSVPTGNGSRSYGGPSGQKTALDILEHIRRKRGLVHASFCPAAVHRLDRETSGVMMFALSKRTQKVIMDRWHTMVTSRLYRALAENPHNPSLLNALPERGLIDRPLVKNAFGRSYVPHDSRQTRFENNKKKCRSALPEPYSQSARTHYRIIQRGKNYTLFELELDTGRKNQIRAHLSFLGFPIAGDAAYRAHTDPVHRLCLHARSLAFTHPFTGKHMHFEVHEPDEWAQLVSAPCFDGQV